MVNSQHWIVVLLRNGEHLTTTEGNWSNGAVCVSGAYTIKNNRLYRNGK